MTIAAPPSNGASTTSRPSAPRSIQRPTSALELIRTADFRQGTLATYALSSANPFNDWLVDQRYAAQSNFDAARVDKHKTGAKQVYDLVERAKNGGLLS
jgi:hypothetical protein